MRVIPQGEEVDIKGCDAEASWCAVSYSGANGFVAGKYLNQSDATAPAWPRVFNTDKGATITLFQPQITSWKDFKELEALVATELKSSADAKPVYGIIGLSAKTVADDASENVTLTDVRTTRLDFSALDRQQLADLALDIGKLIPTDPIVVSQQRLAASLADFERLADVPDIKADPPPIFVSETPAILLQTDGKAVTAPVKGVEGLSFVVNTNWDLFKVEQSGDYYVRSDKSWLTSKTLETGWTETETVPDLFSKLPDIENWKGVKASLPPTRFNENEVPKVFYSEKPAELLIFEGKPALEPIAGTGLDWVSNTTSSVFFHRASKNWYTLLSGRWFSSASLEGPWRFATPDLPEDFLNLPDGAPYSAVRASIPGTSESAMARLRASIPKLARVSTDGSLKVDVHYNGEPKFEPIEGTSLFYAVNANEQVIKVADKYFVLKDGIWFVGDTPTGPSPLRVPWPMRYTRSHHRLRSITPPMFGFTTPNPMLSGTATPSAISIPISPGIPSSGVRDGTIRPTGTITTTIGPTIRLRSATALAPHIILPTAPLAAMATPMVPREAWYSVRPIIPSQGPGSAGRGGRTGRRKRLHLRLQSTHRQRDGGAGRAECLRFLGQHCRQTRWRIRTHQRRNDGQCRRSALAQYGRQQRLYRRQQRR